MIEVVETHDRLILVCSYKNEVYLLEDLLNLKFPGSNYEMAHYKEKSAIYIEKDGNIPEEYQNSKDLKFFINSNISKVAS